jgi:LAO/AO transport system kinase
MEDKLKRLIEASRAGDERSLARLISHVEDRRPGWKDAMKTMYPHTGCACVIGVTGSPGAGKSTLVGEIAKRLVDEDCTIGIIAVDPSSPFSGGALLGDRIRMRDISTLDGIFIRSMATRGELGGLCQAAKDVVRIMDFARKDVILIETVGVGQDEIEVVSASDHVMLVTYPGGGDGIQAIKAGVMEIADLFVVNKSDRGGADETACEISAMLNLATDSNEEMPRVIKTSAITRDGLNELGDLLVKYIHQKKAGPPLHKDHVRQEILGILEREISCLIRERIMGNGNLDGHIEQIMAGKSDPYSAADGIIARFAFMKGLDKKQEGDPQ